MKTLIFIKDIEKYSLGIAGLVIFLRDKNLLELYQSDKDFEIIKDTLKKHNINFKEHFERSGSYGRGRFLKISEEDHFFLTLKLNEHSCYILK